MHQGYGSSPSLYDNLVIVSADNEAGGLIAGLDGATGEFIWKRPRPKLPNYPSPAILSAAGRDQLVMIGCELVTSLDPRTGETLWAIPGSSTETVTTTVTNGELIYSSGGYPNNHIAAIRADGSGELVWENTIRVAVPSMLTRGDHLFAVTDKGVAICFDSSSGEQLWKHRLGTTFSASRMLVGDRIHATNESGTTFVYKASATSYELLTSNELGGEVFATPAICRGTIFTRIGFWMAKRGRKCWFAWAPNNVRRPMKQ